MTKQRKPLPVTFMNIAKEWAGRSTCTSRIRWGVGCVIVNDRDQIIASGYNGAPKGFPHCDDIGCVLDSDGHCTSAIHAEENAILQCAMNGVSTLGCTMYVTASPCPKCSLRIIQAGIKLVVYEREYKGADETVINFETAGVVMHHLEIFLGEWRFQHGK